MFIFFWFSTLLLNYFNYRGLAHCKAIDPIFLGSAIQNNFKHYRHVNQDQYDSSVRDTNKQAAAEKSIRNLLSKPMKEIDKQDLLKSLWDALRVEEIVSIFGHQEFTSSSSAFFLTIPNFDIDITKPKLARLPENHHHQKHGKEFEHNQIPNQSSNISIYLEGFGRQFNLNVYPNQNLLDPNFVDIHRQEDLSEIIEPHLAQKQLGCFYHGSASHQDNGIDDQEGEVALSLCGGMKGFILPTLGYGHHKSHYVIHPLPNRLLKPTDQEKNNASSCSLDRINEVHERPHIIFRRQGDPFPKLEQKSSLSGIAISEKQVILDAFETHFGHKERMKRSAGVFRDKWKSSMDSVKNWPEQSNKINMQIGFKDMSTFNVDTQSNLTVELAVFADKEFFKHMQQNFPEDTRTEITKIVLAMINGIQLLYKDPSLGNRINFVLKRLEVLESDPATLIRTFDVERFLNNFCEWQQSENVGSDVDPLHWDHALMMTGLDLYEVHPDRISNQVVGRSPVAGMCTHSASCSVTEGQNYETVFTVAHEIGHNLGMRHDGRKGENDCDPTSYIMSLTAGYGKSSWSACSKKYLKQFLETEQAKCLFDISTPGITLVDYELNTKLPGERFDVDRQCKLNLGQESFHATRQPLEDVCRELHCRREYFIWTAPPALEGTQCSASDDMWCRAGKCVSRITHQPPPSTNSDLGSNNSQNIASSGSSNKLSGTQTVAIICYLTHVSNIIMLLVSLA